VNKVLVAGHMVRLDPSMAIGKGGEADVYAINGTAALKLFKDPTHPDYHGYPEEQQAAAERLAEQQQKLRRFPLPLPSRVIQPRELATDRQGKLVGYTMRLLTGATPLARYADRRFRATGASSELVTAIFRDLYAGVRGLHQAGVIIGDFNDQNVLVLGTDAYLIDVDSYQFGPFSGRVFSARFVDPLLCQAQGSGMTLAQPYTMDSDWYAFCVLLMQSLLFVDPYSGLYCSPLGAPLLTPGQRPLHRITVFHPAVRYPKPARTPEVLPEVLLDHFRAVFESDQRGIFPERLLAELAWRLCPSCGAEHARTVCPLCGSGPVIAAPAVTIAAKVKITPIFRAVGAVGSGPGGVLLYATAQGETLRWVWHDGVAFRRENGAVVQHCKLTPGLHIRIHGMSTILGTAGEMRSYRHERQVEDLLVDCCGDWSLLEADGQRRYWVADGQLRCDGALGPETIGAVLPRQTRFWVGADMGFGFYRAGRLTVAFVFDPERRGMNDSVTLPALPGGIIDTECVFGAGRCWFLFTMRSGGRVTNHCLVILANGTVSAQAEAEAGDNSWLGSIHGHCAAASFLLAATDEGIVRVESQGRALAAMRRFEATEGVVQRDDLLLPAPNGLYVVNQQEIRLLRLG